jgi:uncharacterized protein YndB with AHSA1/START domain
MVTINTTDDAILGDLEIAAKPETVFSALTDPAQAAQWWGDGQTYRADQWEIDLRVGGKWSSRGKGMTGEPFEVHGEYTKIDPPRLLEYTWLASFGGPQPVSVVRWELQPSAAGTRIKLTHSGLQQYPQIKAMFSGGWPRVLGWLKGHAESKAA